MLVQPWAPRRSGAGIRIVRFTDPLLREGIETHAIDGVSVKVFVVAKTAADCFQHRGKVGTTGSGYLNRVRE